MKKIIAGVCAVCVAMMFAGCTLVVQNETQVKAHNALTNLDVDVDGTTSHVSAIDLDNVNIGHDVSFSSILGGETTSPKTTQESGSLIVHIGTANVNSTLLGIPVSLPFSNIADMSTTIEKGTTNTVEFNTTTAQVIFNALAKKKAK